MSKLNRKKNLNAEIKRLERTEPKPQVPLTERVRAKLNEPYKSPVGRIIKEIKKEG